MRLVIVKYKEYPLVAGCKIPTVRTYTIATKPYVIEPVWHSTALFIKNCHILSAGDYSHPQCGPTKPFQPCGATGPVQQSILVVPPTQPFKCPKGKGKNCSCNKPSGEQYQTTYMKVRDDMFQVLIQKYCIFFFFLEIDFKLSGFELSKLI